MKFVWWEDLDGVCCCPSCGHRVDNYYRDEPMMISECCGGGFC